MKPLDTAVLIKAVFEGNEPSLNACSLPVVDGKKIIKYLFCVYLVPVGENLEKMQENKWKTKKQGSLFPRKLLFQITVQREALELTSSVQWL